VVTLLVEPPLEFPLDDDVESPDWEPVELVVVAPEVVVVVGVDATVVVVVVGLDAAVVVVVVGLDAAVGADDAEVAEDFLARAGSCPETSTIAINNQAATNSATDPATIRRRMRRARAIRALLSACPRARAAEALVSVMSCTSLSSDWGVEASR
jgi:hypothetical protein